MLKIGFANEFYTLWDISTEMQYVTDSYGKHWPSHEKISYCFIKNVSISLETVKSTYPDLEIDMELKGINGSWSVNSKEDLTPNLLKFGKYAGKFIEDVVKTDLQYVVWLSAEANTQVLRDLCLALPEVVEYLHNQEIENQKMLDSHIVLESGVHEVTFLKNPNHCLIESGMDTLFPELNPKYYYTSATIEGAGTTYLMILFESVREVGGMYPYNMAIIDGKAMKVKGKTMKLNLEILLTDKYPTHVNQYAIIKNS